MPIATATATTAAELAAILANYGSMPIVVQVVDTCDGDEVATVVSDVPVEAAGRTLFGLQLEIHARQDGTRFLAVTGFREGC